MKIGFIGAGKVGFSLGRYFAEHELEVTGYYSHNTESARNASEFTKSCCFTSLEEVAGASDMLFLTVPDREIASVWQKIKRFPIQSKLICHCSGAMSSAVFSDIGESGAFGYSVHPLLAVHSKEESYKELSRAFFTLEGHELNMKKVKQLFAYLGNETQIISAEDKIKYHAGAVFVSNHVIALLQTGIELLMQCGFEKGQAEKVLMPLFLNNAQGVADNGVVEALTGPVERADEETIQKHLDCLDHEEQQLYTLLSGRLIQIAQEKHADRNYVPIRHMLEYAAAEQEEMEK